MLANQINMNWENHKYDHKKDVAKVHLPISCMWLSFTFGKYPNDFKYNVNNTNTTIAEHHIPANVYHPNNVEYQWTSIDINQSHDATTDVYPKNTK